MDEVSRGGFDPHERGTPRTRYVYPCPKGVADVRVVARAVCCSVAGDDDYDDDDDYDGDRL